MLDRLSPSAEELATAWIGAFDAALGSRSEIGLYELFVADSHWRNLLGISWHFATFSGNRVIARELLQRAASAGATGFRIDTAALAPRQAMVAGREVIEAVISFDTANGPGIGALRLLPAPSGRAAAWTISTLLDFDRICAAPRIMPRRDHTPGISPARIGGSSGGRRRSTGIASPTFSLSAAATPEFPPPSS